MNEIARYLTALMLVFSLMSLFMSLRCLTNFTGIGIKDRFKKIE
ncbi:hypothetical protein PISS_a1931 [Pseudoalteromonas issachenkonii]|jgi:hypothetical protein|uniref:Uncharacterized protein n=1 Tax=Pseudoalteromonas issachenkonii TaxID=152297 RepID=A0ABN5C8C1_9GAMM|nr:hypothetical protein PSM_A1733 [Pseudoalteromonas sp. SM9913]ATC90801.1 hypothetical protein PISS_a1931 [Pseudoalteromonas issachenkonii]ATD03375.1 hypothetical protein PTET_a1994 [Pseudoalteromonas tetraodonis]